MKFLLKLVKFDHTMIIKYFQIIQYNTKLFKLEHASSSLKTNMDSIASIFKEERFSLN